MEKTLVSMEIGYPIQPQLATRFTKFFLTRLKIRLTNALFKNCKMLGTCGVVVVAVVVNAFVVCKEAAFECSMLTWPWSLTLKARLTRAMALSDAIPMFAKVKILRTNVPSPKTQCDL